MKPARIAALALLPLLVFASTAQAATHPITYKMRASAVGQTSEFTLNQTIDATAPATAAPGSAVAVVIDPAPNTVPAEASGYRVREIKNLALKIPVPANSTYRSATLQGGSGLNSTPTVTLEGSTLVLKLAGPLKGGANFELPTLTINLTAGASGAITSKLGGTSYSDAGLTFTAVVIAGFFPVDAPATGYPDPSPALTTTTIG